MFNIMRLVPLQLLAVPEAPLEKQIDADGSCTGCVFAELYCKHIRIAAVSAGLPSCIDSPVVYQFPGP